MICSSAARRGQFEWVFWRLILIIALVLRFGVTSAGAQTPTSPTSDSPISSQEALEKGQKAYAEKDFITAVFWYRTAAEKGNTDAQVIMGHLYYSGEVLSKNLDEAIHWLLRAADQGNMRTEGMQILAGAYCEQKNYEQAVQWGQKAAEGGEPNYEAYLGIIFMGYCDSGRDLKQGIFWLRKGADDGSIVGQHILGSAYEAGIGVPRNLSQARMWIERAAAGGYLDAQKWLRSHPTAAQQRHAPEINAQNNNSGVPPWVARDLTNPREVQRANKEAFDRFVKQPLGVLETYVEAACHQRGERDCSRFRSVRDGK